MLREISVTVHISTNLPEPESKWLICIKTPDTYTDETKTEILVPGEERSVVLEPGDGMIYKGCERPHWRDPMSLVVEREILFFVDLRLSGIIIRSSSTMFSRMGYEDTTVRDRSR